MAYSEAEVLAGGLAHIPVAVGILIFINNIIKIRTYNSTELVKQDKQNTTNILKKKNPVDQERSYLNKDALNSEINLQEKEVNLTMTEEANLEEESIYTKTTERELQTNSNVQNQSLEEQALFERSLQEKANQIEVEEILRESKSPFTKKESAQASNYKKLKYLNPWNIAALSLLFFSGGAIILFEEGIPLKHIKQNSQEGISNEIIMKSNPLLSLVSINKKRAS